jgi:opacity protein-like surface antigen
VGAGVQFFMTRRWSVDASYRRIFTSAIDTVQNGQPIHVNGDGHQVTGGLNYHF